MSSSLRSEERSSLRLTLLIAAAYALLGGVGLILAIPTGYASPVFPAAGMALVCTLWFGRRALPGVWLGSTTLNLIYTAANGALTTATAAVAVVIGLGALLQALSGARLVTRRAPAWRTMEREQDVLRFLFWGGGVACLVSPLIGVTALHAAGIVVREEFLYTSWIWYAGDTLGVLVFAPLTLCLLNCSAPLWCERRRTILFPLLITLTITLLAFFGAARWDKREEANRLQADGEVLAKRIADRLLTHREVLSSLQHFIEATPDFTFRQFEQFTRITLRDNPDIFALSFNDLVTQERRPEFERLMSRLSPLGSYQITERDAAKRLVRAAPRSEYVAVRYIVPLTNNQPAVGFDIHSEPIRRDAIRRARASGSMAVTAPIKLVQERKQRVGVLELMPVTSGVTTGQGDGLPVGFAVAVVKVDELIDIALRGGLPSGLQLQVIDRQAPAGQEVLYRYASTGDAGHASRRVAAWRNDLRMGDRDWELSLFATDAYLRQHRNWLAWGVGVAGLLFASLLQTLLLGMTGRTALVKQQIEALKASEDRYQRLFNDSPLPTWLYEAGTRRFLMVNDRAVAHYGWPLETFLGMTQFDLLPAEELGAAPDPGPPAEYTRECRHLRRDGAVLDVLVRSTPAEYGEQEARLEVIQDITQEKRNQEELIRKDLALMQSEKLASIGQLAAGVAHEINNPMGFIAANLRVLAEYFDQVVRFDRLHRELDERELSHGARAAVAAGRESLEIDTILEDGVDLIRESLDGAERVAKIVTDLKSYSRVDSPEQECVSLVSCLESALTICHNELKYVATVRKEYEPVPEILCHPGQLNQVFLNLLINAGQAIEPPGEIVLRCWADDDFVYAAVSDTGKGIPEEIRGRIFDPFFTTKEVGEGTGLGLSISYEIVKRHRGELLVESSVGNGTNFTVKLPRSRVTLTEPPQRL